MKEIYIELLRKDSLVQAHNRICNVILDQCASSNRGTILPMYSVPEIKLLKIKHDRGVRIFEAGKVHAIPKVQGKMVSAYVITPADNLLLKAGHIIPARSVSYLQDSEGDARRNTRDDISGIANDTAAYCASQRAKMPRGVACIVYLCKPYLSRGTVAHEFCHSALSILARKKVSHIPCTTENAPVVEEQMAGIVGDLVDEFYRKYGL